MRRALAAALWILFSGAFVALSGVQPATVYGYDPQGRPVTRLSASQARDSPPIVLFFLASDCPISNRYAPEIQRLEKEFAPKDVAFWLVYPNATETAAGVLHHEATYGIRGATLLHPSDRLMAMTHAKITPESAVFAVRADGGALRTVYTGRIDDRYEAFGRERPQATRHDLEDAVLAVLSDQPVQASGGPPVGCGIVSPAVMQMGAGKP